MLSITDIGTRFQYDGFVREKDASINCESIQKLRIDVYAGASDYIRTDTRANFNSAVLRLKAEEHDVAVRIASTRAHDRIDEIEWIHAYLWTVYEKLCTDFPRMNEEEKAPLKFGVKNDTLNAVGGICWTALIYGMYSKLPVAITKILDEGDETNLCFYRH